MKQYPGVVIDYGHGGMIDGTYQTPGGKQYHYTDASGKVVESAYEGVTNRMQGFYLIQLLLTGRVAVYDCVADKHWTEPPKSWRDLEQRDVGLTTRTTRANRYADRIFASLHGNASSNSNKGRGGTARGVDVYTSPGQTQSDPIATSVIQSFQVMFPSSTPLAVRRGDWKDGDPDMEADFHVLRETDGAALLTESGFFDNPSDWAFIKTEEGAEQIALAIYNGLKPFLRVR